MGRPTTIDVYRRPARTLSFSTLALALAVSAMAWGCGDDGGDESAEPSEATFATYNVGLARGFVDYATDRMNPVADAVSETEADAICLQEVWLAEDEPGEWTEEQIDAITEASSDTYPNSYYEITEPDDDSDEEPACSQSESEPLRICVEQNCADIEDDQLSRCALDHCGDEFNDTSSECQTCIASNLGKSLDGILLACRGGSSSHTSNGHNGLLLMSKHELVETELLRMESTVAQRAALHAVVDIPDFGEVDLYCTHLAARLSALDYPGTGYESYEAEQAAQIETVLEWIVESRTGERVVLMGDMNTGPAVGGLDAELPDNYQKFVDAGMRNPYLETDSPDCTFCDANTLIQESSDKAIDHVMFDFEEETEALNISQTERILDETLEIETSEGTQTLHLSDHYGVRTTIALPD